MVKQTRRKVAEVSRLRPHEEKMCQDTSSAFAFFDPDIEVAKLRGTFLPHWRQEGVIYFVTFRLADSLPQGKLKALNEERKEWRRLNPEPHSLEQKHEYFARFTKPIQTWLDAGYGSLLLKNPEANQIVQDALLHFDELRSRLDEYVVAGNHVHTLVSPLGDRRLTDIIRSWKSFTAKQLLKLPITRTLTTIPNVWQQESWDHIVRSGASLEKFREYIRDHR